MERRPIGGSPINPTRRAYPRDFLETGIKAIDLLCPFRKGGKVALIGGMGVGKLVVIEEVVHNIAERQEGVSLFTFTKPGNEVAFWREHIATIAAEPPAGAAQPGRGGG